MLNKIIRFVFPILLCASIAYAGTVTITELEDDQSDVNADEINQLVTPLLNEFNGSIDNVNISSTAAIAFSKINSTGQIDNADISATADIDGSKVDPDFGSQNISTSGTCLVTGQATLGYLTVSNNLSVTGTAIINGGDVRSDSVIKAWGVVDQSGSHSLLDSYNITSVADGGVGITNVTIATDMADTNYCVVTGGETVGKIVYVSDVTAGTFKLRCVNTSGEASDSTRASFTIMGD